MADDDMYTLDRRAFSIGLMFALTAACNTGTQSKAVVSGGMWPLYKQRFLLPEGRIVDTGNGYVSHSEGQGYGMLLALRAGDRAAFDAMAEWTQRNLARSDMALYSWKFDPASSNHVPDPNNATDGDILIAWALADAGQRWNVPTYTDRSNLIRAAIRQNCVIERHGRMLLLPGLQGFLNGERMTFNPSYFIWPAFDRFAQLDGQQVWGGLIADSLALTRLARFGPNQLPTDWVDLTAHDNVEPAMGRAPRFGYDAVRVPLYAAMGKRSALAEPITGFWRARLAQGRTIPAWVDVVTNEEAPYPISNGGAAIVGRVLGTSVPGQLADDYFSASLQLLAMS